MILWSRVMRCSLVLWHIFGGGCHDCPWTLFIMALDGCDSIIFVEYTFIRISVGAILCAS
jgi:hypothetical protein